LKRNRRPRVSGTQEQKGSPFESCREKKVYFEKKRWRFRTKEIQCVGGTERGVHVETVMFIGRSDVGRKKNSGTNGVESQNGGGRVAENGRGN